MKATRGNEHGCRSTLQNSNYNFSRRDQRDKTEAPDPDEGPYQRFKYYKKLKRERLIQR